MGIALTPFLMHSWIFRSVTGTPCAGVYLVSSAFTFAFRGCAENLRVWRKIEEQAASSINKRSLVDRIKQRLFFRGGGGGGEETVENINNSIDKNLLLSTELAGYKKYILRFYLSSFLPLT